MANLKDLKQFAEELLPIVKDLFEGAARGDDRGDTRAERRALDRLRRLVAGSAQPTPGALGQRVETIVATRTLLNEILTQAAGGQVALRSTTVRTLRAQSNALQNVYGLLLERAAFDEIPRLLTTRDIDRLGARLDRAEDAIRTRKKAKRVLDTVVSLATTAAKIALKLG